MANFTQKAIKETFMEMLEERPLSEITVKDIVSKCGINRNTFYYHYQDISALIEEIVSDEAEQILAKYPSVSTFIECFDAVTEFASHSRRMIMHIYKSVNREVFERHLMNVSEKFVANYVNVVMNKDEIGEENFKMIVDYYKCVFFGLILNWLSTGMTDEYVKEVRTFFLLKKDWAVEFASLI